MSKIEVLSDVLASQVAAGEVIERPASVVKELVENSIDSGAQHIEVEIQRGGSQLIRITDNGCGMSKEDTLMSLKRHATSKLKHARQLNSIATMGFRGEAVPSIASVSKLRIASQESNAIEGTEVIIEGGEIKKTLITGMQAGSVFEIKELFFNVPARRKFMRTENTESAHIEHQIKLHALAYPEIRFTFKKENRIIFDVPATQDRRTRITGLSGKDIGSLLIEVPLTEYRGMKVSGYVLPFEYARKGKRQQFIFLNGRPIEDSAISRAIKDGFKSGAEGTLNPTAWLWLSMNPSLVDVNVHPAKKEVRFQKPFEIRDLVLNAVEQKIAPQKKSNPYRGEAKIISRKTGGIAPLNHNNQHANHKSDHKLNATATDTSATALGNLEHSSKTTLPRKEHGQPLTSDSASISVPQPSSQSFPKPSPQQGELEIPQAARPRFSTIGTLHNQYILLEGEEGLVLLNPKIARERIAYEALLAQAANGKTLSQGLLVAEVIHLDSHDLDIVMKNQRSFEDAGITLEPFGGNSIQVTSLPTIIKHNNPREIITKLIDELVETQGKAKTKQLTFQTFAATIAARIARYEPVDLSNAQQLLDEMFQCDLPYCNAQGKPTLVQISLSEIEKKFKA